MATVNEAAIDIGNLNGAVAYAWTPLTAANAVGRAVDIGNYNKKSVAVFGTFDSATVVLQGTYDGTNWFTLTNRAGTAVSFTSAGHMQIDTRIKSVRPSSSGGGGSQSVTVQVMAAQ